MMKAMAIAPTTMTVPIICLSELLAILFSGFFGCLSNSFHTAAIIKILNKSIPTIRIRVGKDNKYIRQSKLIQLCYTTQNSVKWLMS